MPPGPPARPKRVSFTRLDAPKPNRAHPTVSPAQDLGPSWPNALWAARLIYASHMTLHLRPARLASRSLNRPHQSLDTNARSKPNDPVSALVVRAFHDGFAGNNPKVGKA